jgi:hypothetical protein
MRPLLYMTSGGMLRSHFRIVGSRARLRPGCGGRRSASREGASPASNWALSFVPAR